MMNLFSGNRMLESKVLRLSDSIERFEYPYKDRMATGFRYFLLCEGWFRKSADGKNDETLAG